LVSCCRTPFARRTQTIGISSEIQQLRLPDGRLLGYSEHGRPEGTPVIYCHGSPGSRLAWELFFPDGVHGELNLRVVVPDRPGLGHSTPQPGRRLVDWPADAAALADHLGLRRFAVLGYSGGGPYAAACALAIPERLTRVAIVSGTAPFGWPGVTKAVDPLSLQVLLMSRQEPGLFRLAVRLLAFGARRLPGLTARVGMTAVSAPDRTLLRELGFRDRLMTMVRDAARQGPDGIQQDLCLMVSDWGFRPEEIRIPVRLWHGDADENAPIAMGRAMAAAIPRCMLTPLPGEGHLSGMQHYGGRFWRLSDPSWAALDWPRTRCG
jgi:pimeloyl-ACP methyl ester carboxylesterase